MRQLTLDLGLAPLPTLEAFCADGNEAALDALQRWLHERPSEPLYLWGPSGCGKTHLLRAIDLALTERGERAGWLDAAGAVRPFDDGWAAVLLDDVQRYDAVRQAAAFNWFVNAQTPAWGAPRPLLAAGDRPPADLPLRDDLRTRLAWGQVHALRPLPEPACRAVLRRQAQARGFVLPEEVLDYMLARCARDLGSLTALLERLDGYALRTQRPVTVPLVRAMLAEA